jgi:hypothetical protein
LYLVTNYDKRLSLKIYFLQNNSKYGYRGEKEENWKGIISYNSGRVYIKDESGETINSYILLSKGIYKDLGDNMYGYIFTSKAELVTGTVIITEICKAKTTIGYQFILSNGWTQTYFK